MAKVGKKLVVACDGTWLNADQPTRTTPTTPIPVPQPPSNIVRLIRALSPFSPSGTPQIGFYQRGSGTDADLEDKGLGGLTGFDVAEHIREAYAFLADNFVPRTQRELDAALKGGQGENGMDEIILFGFSRGAFTVRALADLVSEVGLLTERGMEDFWGVVGDWMEQNDKEVLKKGGWASWFKRRFGRQVKWGSDEYRQTLMKEGLTRYGMPIRCVGVFDTVGSLGIPLPWHSSNVKAFSFVDTKVARSVQYAFQALALDEHRHFFVPTLWEQPDAPNSLKELKQCWFPGAHSNIGGSYADAGIANICLAWMVSQMEKHEGGLVGFDKGYLEWVQDLNAQGYYETLNDGKTMKEKARAWGMEKLYDSSGKDDLIGILEAVGPIKRTPGRYNEIETEDGKPTKIPLKGTGECVHRCVRVRVDGGGMGLEEDDGEPPKDLVGKVVDGVEKVVGGVQTMMGIEPGKYKAPALKNFQMVQPVGVQSVEAYTKPGKSGVVWKAKDGGVSLPEDEFEEMESLFLKRSLAHTK